MTALCGGGPSAPQGYVSGAIGLSSLAVEAFLDGLGFPDFASFVATSIASMAASIDVVAYCGTDPPSDPGLTAGDIADALNFGDAATNLPALQKVSQWFLSRYWYQICTCTTTTTPTPPALSDPGPVSTSPGLPSSGPGSFCWDVTISDTVASGTVPIDYTASAFPAGPTITVSPWTTGAPTTAVAIPAGITQAILTTNAPPVAGGNAGLSLTYLIYNSSGTLIDLYTAAADPTGAGLTNHVAEPIFGSAGAYWSLQAQGNTNGVACSFQTEIQFYCPGTGPTTLQMACCPPNPLQDNSNQQILSLLMQIWEALPVRVPSYAAGVAYTGLSGSGSQALTSTCIAIRIDVTTIPTIIGVDSGEPDYYFDMGFISPLTNEGPEAGVRLTYATQVIPLGDAVVAADYTLLNGTIVTITELQAG